MLKRNIPRTEKAPTDVREPEHYAFDDPAGKFDVPEGYEKKTPWNVAAYWQEQLVAAGRWPDNYPTGTRGVRMGLRPAKMLLEKYEYADILRAIRWWTSPRNMRAGRVFSLNWMLKNMDLFYQRLYERRNK